MGREYVELKVTASVSKHNSLRDRLDQARWDHLREQVEQLVNDPEYAEISPMVV